MSSWIGELLRTEYKDGRKAVFVYATDIQCNIMNYRAGHEPNNRRYTEVHFLITAYDGKDSEAGARRQGVREQHIEDAKQLFKDRKLLYAAAILDDAGNMIGSTLIVDFPSKEAILSQWLDNEIYVTANVWHEIDIKPCRVPDFILDKI